jgi:hypothetical protein
MCKPLQEIKSHPFFEGVDWAGLHARAAPYVPRVDHELDTQNFERFDEDMNMNSPGDDLGRALRSSQDLGVRVGWSIRCRLLRVDRELDTQNFERCDEDMNMNLPGTFVRVCESRFRRGLEGAKCRALTMSWTHRTLSALAKT